MQRVIDKFASIKKIRGASSVDLHLFLPPLPDNTCYNMP